MVQKVDYYALLSRAVGSLERDAYAARGAIYDREHKALLKRLISSSTPCTDADIMREEQAFRDAVRQIEFPDEAIQAPRTPQREPEAPWPNSAREKARALRRESPPQPANDPDRAGEPKRPARPRWDAGFDETGSKPLGRQLEPSPGNQQEEEPGWYGEERKSHSFVKLAAAYVVVVATLVAVVALGYAYVAGGIDLTRLASWAGPAAPQAQRAVLYEGGQSGRTGTGVEGKAIWGTRMEPNGAGGKADMVVTLDVEIPQQRIALNMTLSRVADAGGMSHLLELRFAKPEELPFGGISRIANIALKGAETEAGESMVGTSINIAPGHFMFGLLGVEDVIKQNVQRLRTQGWLDLAIVFANGAPYTLTIEKGAAGERAINEALAKWGQ